MNKMKTSRYRPTLCLRCGYCLDTATGEGKPSPGDVSICMECHHIMCFADDMTMREPTAEELVEIAKNKDIARCLAALRMVKQYRKTTSNLPI